MTFVPHYRVSVKGVIGGSGVTGVEAFQFGVNLAPPGAATIADLLGSVAGPNNDVLDKIVSDTVAYWTDDRMRVSPLCRLTQIKLAHIGANGKYASEPMVADVGPTAGEGTDLGMPFQSALAVTLLTNSGLSRVKGRYYLPIPCVGTGSNGTYVENVRDDFEAASAKWLSDLANQPGFDVLNLAPVVASQGRQSPAEGPKNYKVTHVQVGRVIDTMRSRRRSLDEFRGTPTALNL